ncbi:hypothetical protein LOK49_LG05G01247 [Camellia lanceoleosa]|uniref:Uncharacterized protein n=1 Tax=Camellia lanceoleosa TaxID=1840588 RepID=A0ACC0HRJ5_9ERIC|nr:hypothetical protein LOK49_LG05G01247 [Camellia lanceoleosa]
MQSSGTTPSMPTPMASSPSDSMKKWCVANDEALQANTDFVCSSSSGWADCTPIEERGPCFDPNTVRSHASYAMTAYYQANSQNDFNCDFINTGVITVADPSMF